MAQWSRDVKIRAKLSSNYWAESECISQLLLKSEHPILVHLLFFWQKICSILIFYCGKFIFRAFLFHSHSKYQNRFYFWIPTITTIAVIKLIVRAWVLLVENLRRLHSLLPMEKRSLLYSCYLPSPLVASEIIKCTFVPFVSCTSSLF